MADEKYSAVAYGGRPVNEGLTPFTDRMPAHTGTLSMGGVEWVGDAIKCNGVTKYGRPCNAARVNNEFFCAGHMKGFARQAREQAAIDAQQPDDDEILEEEDID